MRVQVEGRQLTPKGYEQITGLSVVKALAPPAGAISAVVRAEAQAVRWRDDGTDPSAAVGMPLAVGEELVIADVSLSVFRFIEQAASAKLNVSYYA